MATKLATAYVQILPSTKDMKGNLTQALNGEAGSAGKSAGGVFSGTFGKVLKGSGALLAGGVATATASIVGLSKASIDAYADFEQLEGGIQTLFKDDWGIVAKNASQAFKTSGMSANEYMETVTSFSASLIQSVGGDTLKASQQADKALVMMSDNANKMGTSLESIQNAFRGFAKQNYTMLDNLSLGYGGTKQEMERLLADATALSGVEYDMSSYSDIIDAIGVIQDQLGITGTTAKEASSTISGSIGMLKASWTDLLAGMANENADMTSLMDNVASSFGTVLENITPKVAEILTSISSALGYLLPQLITSITDLLPTILPLLVDSAIQIVQALIEVLPSIMESFQAVIPTLIDAIIVMLPMLIDTGLQVCMQLAQGIAESLPTLIPAVVQMVLEIVNTLLSNVDLLVQTATALVNGLSEGLVVAIPMIMQAMPQIILAIVQALIEAIPALLECGVNLIVSLAGGIASEVPNLLSSMGELVQLAVQKVLEGLSKFKEAGANVVNGLWEGIKGTWDKITNWVTQKCSELISKVKNVFQIHSPSRVFGEIGGFMAMGLGEGFTSEMDSVNNDIASSINTDFELGATTSIADAMATNNSPINASPYDAMQQAFNEGLIRIEISASADGDNLFNQILVKNAEYKKMHGGNTAFA